MKFFFFMKNHATQYLRPWFETNAHNLRCGQAQPMTPEQLLPLSVRISLRYRFSPPAPFVWEMTVPQEMPIHHAHRLTTAGQCDNYRCWLYSPAQLFQCRGPVYRVPIGGQLLPQLIKPWLSDLADQSPCSFLRYRVQMWRSVNYIS